MDTSPGLVEGPRSGGSQWLKALHVFSTAWFIACLVYLLVVRLRETQFGWWVGFSVFAYSGVAIFVLVSLYLFALFRGISRNQYIQPEHPLTCSDYYMAFYAASPFLGGLAGALSGVGLESGGQFMRWMTWGTLVATLLVWVVIDPCLALVEGLLPPSRQHRASRLARQEAERQEREAKRQQVLAQVIQTEQTHRALWQQALEAQARELSSLLTTDTHGLSRARARAVEIGAEAWRLGGIGCMRQLREMALSAARQGQAAGQITDFLPYWWDGIGTWRGPNS
jgi:hypothetical protein